MKNIFRILMAVAVLFTASCAKEEISSSIAGGEVEVSFTANLADLGTRAEYGTGNYVNTLRYKVFSDGELLNDLCGTIEANDGTKFYSVNLVLIKGMSYDILFWADHDAQYTISNEGVVSFSTDGLKANDETRDAFYYLTEDFDPANANSENTTITLRRPFAQLNAIVPNMDKVGESIDLTTDTIQSWISTKICTSFNPFTGEAGDETNAVVTFGETNVQDIAEGHLSMNYLLAPSHLVDVTFYFKGAKFESNTAVNNIPLKANYKTNVIGNLLTGATEFNVEILPGFATAENTIFTAFKEGGEVTLTENITIAEPLVVAAGVKAVLNLNGHNIINTTASEVYGEGEGIIAYGDLTINGTGTVQGTTMAVWARGNDGAKVTINGGTYKGCAEGFAKGGRSVIYASSGNTINIYGGTFESLAADQSSYANKTEGVYAALNIADNNGNINVYGGSFYKQNPAAPGTEPAAWNTLHPNGFVAEGYKAVEIEDHYYVLPEVVADAAVAANVTAVTESTADVATALATDNGKATMYMWNDVAYIAKYGEVVIASSADEATTTRGIVEYATALTSATVAEGVEVVGNRTFRKCANLETVNFPNSLTEIGPAVFQSCSKLANVTIPASVTTIGEGAFAECTSLTSINIPDGVTRIEDNTFNASGLESIEFHAGVTYFGAQAFRDCKQLKKVVINAPEFTIEANAFGVMAGALPGTVIYVANAEMKAYLESTLAYKNQFTIIVLNSVSTADELIEAVAEGGIVVLNSDITLSEALEIPAGVILNGNGKQINGTIYAGGDLTFVGHTKVTAFSATYYNRTITIGDGACLEVTGSDRVSLAYGNTFDITGNVVDAKTADKTAIQPSLIIPGGISITGGNDATMNITNAYVKIGSTSSKNSAANGTFTINIENSIAEFTDQLTFAEPTSGKNPTFNINVKNSVLTTGAKLCIAALNSNMVVDNSIVTLGTYLRNSGTLTLKNGSVLTGKTIQFGENGGNNGTINVDASSMTITAGSTGNAFDGKGVGSINATNGATVNVDYYKAMTINVDASTFTGTEVK